VVAVFSRHLAQSIMNINLARILVVDDEEVMRVFVANSLRRLGIQSIETATDGASALRAMASFKPDLVLTDIHMQPMNGLELVRHLRAHANPLIKNMKVVFMSADASTATLQDAVPLGTYGYIVKPPRLDTLKAKIEQALK
jgi:two-component system chemotaxis response regulator CheY